MIAEYLDRNYVLEEVLAHRDALHTGALRREQDIYRTSAAASAAPVRGATRGMPAAKAAPASSPAKQRGLSLHLGLNYVDPKHYNGWNGELFACEADANDMTALALSRGFTPTTLLREQAHSGAVKSAIQTAAQTLKSGDTFLITNSSHGGQVPDTNGDEGRNGDTADGMDETWCLFDRQLIDDELAALYAQFSPGVRIIVLSDSCHSGTVIRDANQKPQGRARVLPPILARDVYARNKELYDGIQQEAGAAEQQEIKATVLLISGCQDRQLSRDGDFNGAFTGTLKTVWDGGKFTGNYQNFRDQIAAKMSLDQIPNYFVTGAKNEAFENEAPFTIAAATAAKSAPPAMAPKKAAKPAQRAKAGQGAKAAKAKGSAAKSPARKRSSGTKRG